MDIHAQNSDQGYLGSLKTLITNLIGDQGEVWLHELKKFLRKDECWSRRAIKVTRSRFNPAKFIGQNWNLWKDQADNRSAVLKEFDLTKVDYVTMLICGETHISSEEALKRLKRSGYIRLGADILFTLWKNQHLIPESWKEKVNGNIRRIFFDGTVLLDPEGDPCVLYLYWSDHNRCWNWDARWLNSDRESNDLSAVIEKMVT